MGTNKSVISLNGKLYDAKTGKLISDVRAVKHLSDDIVLPAAMRKKQHPANAHKQPRSHSAAHNKRKTQRSRTLMRNVVKPPYLGQDIRVSAIAAGDQPSVSIMEADMLSLTVKNRHGRAEHVKRSRLISKFGPLGSQPTFQVASGDIPVRPHPVHNETTSNVHNSKVHESSSQHELFAKTLRNAQEPAKPRKKQGSKKKAAKVLSTAGSALAVVMVAGFVYYQASTGVEFKMAATRAGIAASLPGYTPSGYGVSGPIEYAPGQVAVRYGAKGDDRSYTVTQRSSSWNSETLLNTQVLGASSDYQEVDSKGKTIFIYDDDKATWVDGNIKYEITGTNNLTTEQIKNIADSF